MCVAILLPPQVDPQCPLHTVIVGAPKDDARAHCTLLLPKLMHSAHCIIFGAIHKMMHSAYCSFVADAQDDAQCCTFAAAAIDGAKCALHICCCCSS